MSICDNKAKVVYKGGVCHLLSSVIQGLEGEGIELNQSKIFNFRITYDFEASPNGCVLERPSSTDEKHQCLDAPDRVQPIYNEHVSLSFLCAQTSQVF